MSEWLAMGGYGFYVWSAYGMLALAVIVELVSLRRRRKAAWQYVDDARDEFEYGPDTTAMSDTTRHTTSTESA